jgi:hypothetical protein
MIAVIQTDPDQPPHIIKWTGRKNFHVEVLTYCEERFDASDGVLQVPDNALVCFKCKLRAG